MAAIIHSDAETPNYAEADSPTVSYIALVSAAAITVSIIIGAVLFGVPG